MGVIFAFLQVPTPVVAFMKKLSAEQWMMKLFSQDGYYLLGFCFFCGNGICVVPGGYRQGPKAPGNLNK